MWCPHKHAYHKVSVNRKQGGLSRAVTRVGNNNCPCVCATCQIQIFSFHSVAVRSTVTKNNLGRKGSVWFILPSQNLREIPAGTGARAACCSLLLTLAWLSLTEQDHCLGDCVFHNCVVHTRLHPPLSVKTIKTVLHGHVCTQPGEVTCSFEALRGPRAELLLPGTVI